MNFILEARNVIKYSLCPIIKCFFLFGVSQNEFQSMIPQMSNHELVYFPCYPSCKVKTKENECPLFKYQSILQGWLWKNTIKSAFFFHLISLLNHCLFQIGYSLWDGGSINQRPAPPQAGAIFCPAFIHWQENLYLLGKKSDIKVYSMMSFSQRWQMDPNFTYSVQIKP